MVIPDLMFPATRYWSSDDAVTLAIPIVDTVPAVPDETYPAVTVGVIDCEPSTFASIFVGSSEFTLMVIVGLIEVVGVFAEPLATDLDALLE